MKIVLEKSDVVEILKARAACCFYDLGEREKVDEDDISFNDYLLPYEDLVFTLKPEVKDE